jgi:capsular exopolysaccharide synthesis family protein
LDIRQTDAERRLAVVEPLLSGAFFLQILMHRRRTVILFTGACVALAILYLIFAAPVYTITSRLYIAQNSRIISDLQSANSADRPYLNTQCELITSTPILAIALGQPEAQTMQMFKEVENRIEYLKENITTSIGKEDELITVEMDSPYPDEASQFLAAVVDAYLNYQSAQRKTTAADMLVVMQKHRAQLLSELSEKNKVMVQFKREHGTVSFNEENDSIVMRSLTSMSEALVNAKLNTLTAKAAYDAAARTLPPGARQHAQDQIGAVALDEKTEAELQLTLSASEQRLQELRDQYLPRHPMVKTLEARVAQLRIAYVGALERKWEVAQQMETNLQATLDEQQRRALDQAGLATEYAQLEADVRRLETSAQGIDAKINDLHLADDAQGLTMTVLEPAAASNDPTSPRKARTLVIALFLGLMLGVGVASAQELMDPRLRTPEQVQTALGLPVLAAVPMMSSAMTQPMRAQTVSLDPHSEVSEAYRMIRTMVFHTRLERKIKTILVTSPGPREGKTTLASNLAIAMAMAKERILLIDADTRRPLQHKMFEVSNESGLASILEGDDNWDKSIQPTDIKNLDIMPSGPMPFDPVELLNSQKFGEVLDELGKCYDRIVLDAPPVLMAPDARILGACCDATVLVLNSDRIRRKMCEQACDDLVSIGAHVLGVVVNGVQRGGSFASATRQAYGHSYDLVGQTPLEVPLATTIRPGHDSPAADDSLVDPSDLAAIRTNARVV